MNMKKNILAISLAAVFTFGGSAMADTTDGTIGTTSEGTADVSLTIPAFAQVTGMTDLAFGSWSGTGDQTATDTVCVYDNSDGAYDVTFTGSAGFVMASTATVADTVAYSVVYNDGTSDLTMVSGTAQGAVGANTTATDCSSTDTGTITLTIAEATLAASTAHNDYTDVLTMLVATK